MINYKFPPNAINFVFNVTKKFFSLNEIFSVGKVMASIFIQLFGWGFGLGVDLGFYGELWIIQRIKP
jgi:hypothetical protein